jgi:uncharacterized membrane protein
MTQDDGGYDLAPKPEKAPEAPAAVPPGGVPPAGEATDSTVEAAKPSPKPGEPGWVPPVPVIEPADKAVEEEEDPDVAKFKGMAILAYILFLIPLVAAPNSKFARYHANQGLLLFILLIVIVIAVCFLEAALWLVAKFVTIGILAFFFGCGFHLLEIGVLVAWVVLTIMGIINAANGLKKPLPVIGHWTLIH